MDGLKVHGRRGHLRIAGLGAGLVLVVGAWATMSAAPAGAETGCALAGSWFDSTEEVGSTTWVIKADGSAKQSGLGNATAKPGGATLSNDTLKIVWTTAEDEEGQPHGPDDDYAGVLEWKLKADCTGVGTLTFTKVAEGDPRNGNVYRSTVTGPPPIACRAAADRTLARAPECTPDTRVVFGFEARKLPDPDQSHGDGDIVQIEAQGKGKLVRRFSGSGGTVVNDRWKATIAIEANTTHGDDLTVLKSSGHGSYEQDGTHFERTVSLAVTVKSSTLKGCKDGENGQVSIAESDEFHRVSVKYCGRRLSWLDEPDNRFHTDVSYPEPIPGPV